MKRLTITIPDELHRKISEIRGKRIADEARSVPMNEIVNELLCKALKKERAQIREKGINKEELRRG